MISWSLGCWKISFWNGSVHGGGWWRGPPEGTYSLIWNPKNVYKLALPHPHISYFVRSGGRKNICTRLFVHESTSRQSIHIMLRRLLIVPLWHLRHTSVPFFSITILPIKAFFRQSWQPTVHFKLTILICIKVPSRKVLLQICSVQLECAVSYQGWVQTSVARVWIISSLGGANTFKGKVIMMKNSKNVCPDCCVMS
jgi:hypothetical protein